LPCRRRRDGESASPGHCYGVKIDVRVPGEEVVTGEHHRNDAIEVAVRGAFDAMGRRLEDYVRRRRGQVKQHRSDALPQPGEAAQDDGDTQADDSAKA
jgi:hypothetical protein